MGFLNWRIAYHFFFIVFGLFMSGIGTFTTVQDIVGKYHDPIEMQYGSEVPTIAPTV